MIDLVITVPGNARGKGRPRFGNGRTYTDSKTQNAEAWIKACAIQQVGQPCLTGPLSLTVLIDIEVPASWSKIQVKERPTREDALQALQKLRGLLKGFPFVSELDFAVTISGVLTTVSRGAIGKAPMVAIRASTAGTGKSFLIDVISVIATARTRLVGVTEPDAIACMGPPDKAQFVSAGQAVMRWDYVQAGTDIDLEAGVYSLKLGRPGICHASIRFVDGRVRAVNFQDVDVGPTNPDSICGRIVHDCLFHRQDTPLPADFSSEAVLAGPTITVRQGAVSAGVH